MIVYVTPPVLVRAYLRDAEGHEEAAALLADPDLAAVTGSWTRIEASSALVRAARADAAGGAVDVKGLMAILDSDLGLDGPVTVIGAPQEQVESEALRLVRVHALRERDAWHLAVARLAVPPLVEPGEHMAFAARDPFQREIAEKLGFRLL